jgi:hypothetical protein
MMIPAGYLAKSVINRPDWLKADGVLDIYSLSNCMSKEFADYIHFWKHNGYWLFNAPAVIEQIAKEHAIDLTGTTMFYYEVYELEFDEGKGQWVSFKGEESFPTEVVAPASRKLEGYDVVSFAARTSPEYSPLSCNSLATSIKTNSHCLLTSFDDAKRLVEAGMFNDSEPGPYRIFAVYTLQIER